MKNLILVFFIIISTHSFADRKNQVSIAMILKEAKMDFVVLEKYKSKMNNVKLNVVDNFSFQSKEKTSIYYEMYRYKKYNDSIEFIEVKKGGMQVLFVRIKREGHFLYFPMKIDGKSYVFVSRGFFYQKGKNIYRFGVKYFNCLNVNEKFNIKNLSIISLLDLELFPLSNVLIRNGRIVCATKINYNIGNKNQAVSETKKQIENENKSIIKNQLFGLDYYNSILRKDQISMSKNNELLYKIFDTKSFEFPLWYYDCRYSYYQRGYPEINIW